jgi:hypothetical protein
MRLLLLVVITLAFFTVQASANPVPSAILGLYGDAAGTIDVVYTDGTGNVTFYAVLTVLYPEAEIGEIQFFAAPPPCLNAVYVGDSGTYPWGGDSRSGVMVVGPPFTPGSYHVLTITYAAQGITPDCCWFEPELIPGSYYMGIEGVWVNPDEPRTCVSPVEQSTWGAIKAMYR